MSLKSVRPVRPRNGGGKRELQAPRGMHDVLPDSQLWWKRLRKAAEGLADFYNFRRLDTPILESAAVFERGIGEETDIIQKEMYTVKTKGGDLLSLRPELTAPLIRAYLEHHLVRLPQPQKFFLFGPAFRHDNPQAGRYRQFTQIEFDTVGGPNDPMYDAQIIVVFQRFFEEIKVQGIRLSINSIGCRVCRPLYKRSLQNYYKSHEKKLCANCVRRLKTNPLRLLDCKEPGCIELKGRAPNFFDKLCSACSTHLKSVLEYLDELGVSYVLDNQLVRGLDYYSRTVFEFFTEAEGAEAGAIGGGGRYDYLAEMLGGRPTAAVGGAASVERLLHVLDRQGATLEEKHAKRVFLIHVGEMAKKKSLAIIEDLRRSGIQVAESLGRESLKAQLKTADKEGAQLALIFGQKEFFEGTIIVRDLVKSLQETVPLDKLVPEIRKRLK